MELINQPFTGQLGERIIELLASNDYHTFNIAVAFAKNSGVLRIKDSLERFRERGGVVNAYVGIDLGGTSYEALTALRIYTNSLSVIHAESTQTFHVKIYEFLGECESLIVVGSHNLTGGGLWTNFESSILAKIAGVHLSETETAKTIHNYIHDFRSLGTSIRQITSQADIDELLTAEYVAKEVTGQLRLAEMARKHRGRKHLFGSGTPAKLPRIVVSSTGKPIGSPRIPEKPIGDTPSGEGPTIWFETKSMTGGSRNILDLSKRSLIERGEPKGTPFDLGDSKFMRGGVEFFGLDPTALEETKDITINFDGVDYIGNTILYPVGARANGTWRLQFKGVSSFGTRITEAFRAKGETYYLVNKIITLTAIQSSYYFLSVFPQSDIQSFKDASRILARNGSTKSAKQMGLL